MMNFDFLQPTKIHFGKGTLNKLAALVALQGKKALLVTTPNSGALKPLFEGTIADLTRQGIGVVHFDKVIPNPTTDLIDEGLSLAFEHKIDVVIGLGGGSSIDTAKVIALANGQKGVDWKVLFTAFDSPFGDHPDLFHGKLPMIAVTTTSGTGSQVTQAAVVTNTATMDKHTVFHKNCFPDACIIDPELMLSLPSGISASTGFDAFSHAFEAYINKRASTYTEMLSLRAIEIIIEYLPLVLKDEQKIEYREKMAYADLLAGIALANSGADAPHPLSEIICGVCPHIAHGQSLAMVYPGYIQYKSTLEPVKFAAVARLFNPELKTESDTIASQMLYESMDAFLSQINLRLKLSDFNPSQQNIKDILSCPVLNYLPMASSDKLIEMIESGL